MMREVSDDAHEKTPENNENGDAKPKVADWRYGPAQVWYDMLEVPASGYAKENETKSVIANKIRN